MLKIVRWAAYLAVVVVLAGWGLMWAGVLTFGRHGTPIAGVELPPGITVGGPFTLVGTDGQKVDDTAFRGRWMLVYFGYTFCPDVCPTELQTVANAMDALGPLAARVAPIFISVDPKRDTPAVMAQYVKLFDPRLIGLTGSEQQVSAAERAYRVYAAPVESKGSTEYLMNHSSFIYLMGPDGRFRQLFKQGTPAQEIADAIRARIAAG